LFEATVSFFARLMWFSLTQSLGYWTGRAIIQGLSLGSLDVSDYGFRNQKPFKIFWRRGNQLVVSYLAAIAMGQLLWFGAILYALVYLLRG
jgi:hypothetical protein